MCMTSHSEDQLVTPLRRLLLGALFAPALLALILAVCLTTISGYGNVPGHADKIVPQLLSLAVLSYGICFMMGVPIVGGLYIVGRLGTRACVVAAFICGLAMAGFWVSKLSLVKVSIATIGTVSCLAAICAALVAFMFCRIAKIDQLQRANGG